MAFDVQRIYVVEVQLENSIFDKSMQDMGSSRSRPADVFQIWNILWSTWSEKLLSLVPFGFRI